MPLDARARPIDLEAFAAELDALHEELKQRSGQEDLDHLRKVERVGRAASALGYATAWIAPNPLSVFALSLGTYVRWTGVAHPVLHRGYDRCPETPRSRRSKVFAKGRRRLQDWFDWIAPAAWCEEHNVQHHYRLNEEADPDLVERNLSWLRDAKIPRAAKRALIPVLAATWKWVYYAPNTMEVLEHTEARRQGEPPPESNARTWLECWLPYFGARFVAMPLAFLPLGPGASANVWINSLLAELLTNLHAFVTIVPSHAGEDLYRFEGRAGGRPEFYLRQVQGSANYRTGGFVNDLLHGWLNYQIEHHLFPDLSLRRQEEAAPRVREICERHGVDYIQESVWTRVRKTVAIMTGEATMKRA